MRLLLALSLCLSLAACGPATPTTDAGTDAPVASDAPIATDAPVAADVPTTDAPSADAATPGTLDACFEGLAPRVATRTYNVLEFVGDGGAIRVRLAREVGERSAVGETFAYDLVRFGIEIDGEVTCFTEPSSLAYDFGHHNWNDTATATGEHEHAVTMRYDVETGSWNDTLSIDGGADVPLENVACLSLPTFDANHCLLRDDL
jgi:hypothetical protein